MMDFIKKLDAFPTASDDFRKKTTSGAIGEFSSPLQPPLKFFTSESSDLRRQPNATSIKNVKENEQPDGSLYRNGREYVVLRNRMQPIK